MNRAYISNNFARLLGYIVKYRKLRGSASRRLVLEQLILAYAKQLTTGMPEQLWRDNIMLLINECELEHQEKYYGKSKK